MSTTTTIEKIDEETNETLFAEISSNLDMQIKQIVDQHIMALLVGVFPATFEVDDQGFTMSGYCNVIITISPNGYMLLTDASIPIQHQLCWRKEADLKILTEFVKTNFIPQLQRDYHTT